jgi:ribose transport system substrate-binding protein
VQQPPPDSSAGRVTYAIVPKMLNNPVFTLAQRGAQKAAKELKDVDVVYQSSETGVAAEQAEVIRTLTARKVAGMSISVIDANAVKEVIDQAVDAGINVITFDSDCPGSKRKTFYAVNDEAVGKELANQLLAAVGGKANMKGEIGILSGQSSAPNLQGRVKGVLSVLNKKDFPGVTILPTLFCDDKQDVAVEKISQTMAKHPDLRGWVFVGGWPLFVDGALNAVKDPARTKVVSMDALTPERAYVRSGQVYCLVAQRCFAWGEESVKILENLRTKKKTEYPPFLDAGYDLVFKEPTAAQRKDAEARGIKAFSVGDYDKLWDTWEKSAQ